MRHLFCLLIALTLPASAVFSQLRLAKIFGNHMVLQQSSPVPVWGWAPAGSLVQIRCSWAPGQVFNGNADAQGAWSVTLPTPTGSLTPREIEITAGTEKTSLTDVLIGDVWLCSGQSNMEYRVEESGYTPEQTQAAAYPHIRHLKINHAVSLQPETSLQDVGDWQVCSDETVQQFTAVGYFFARDLAERYGIPIGLVHSSWGGSQVESWISGASMAQSDLFKNYMARFPKTWAEADAIALTKLKTTILGADQSSPDSGQESAYQQPDFDISAWRSINPTFAWDWQGIWAFRGDGYMATDVEVSEKAAANAATLHLGIFNGPAELLLNGTKIWSGENAGNGDYPVPAGVLKPGKNRLLFLQKLGKATDWVEMGMRGKEVDFWLETTTGRQSLVNGWRGMPGFNGPYFFVHSSNNLGTAIYNAMIHPIIRFPLKGVIWYQGETNAIRAYEYRQAFPLLIRDWRRAWGAELPFIFVQLANWEAGNGNSNTGSDWAELREAQMLTLELPRTGMAVAVDIGDSKDIHPKNKHDVGKRLAHEARRIAYGEPSRQGSPTKPVYHFLKNSVEITFNGVNAPLVVRNKYGYVHGFELAGEDQVFHYAKAEIKGNTLFVHAEAVSHPVAVRYAWADDPFDVNLYTADGFPIAPFRSDNWKCKTERVHFDD
ncbi:MAG: sialate O-acetylesterase [Lewinellaceae bacterium]|nr:sialate O-acetylesterase [Lewinellaceae bacterium]